MFVCILQLASMLVLMFVLLTVIGFWGITLILFWALNGAVFHVSFVYVFLVKLDPLMCSFKSPSV